MKKIYALLALLVFSVSSISVTFGEDVEKVNLSASNENVYYTTSDDFLEAEGLTCKVATDGCNTVMINNGELGWMTQMYCEETYGTNGKEAWSCLEEKAKTYKTSEEFLEAEGQTCAAATDGCNTITIVDGKLTATTLKACIDHEEVWSCIAKVEEKTEEEAKYYTTSEDFLAAEWGICQTATDGCNTVMINDGKLGGMTEMYCEDTYGENGQEKWSCTHYLPKVYPSSEEFLKAEGQTCAVATDGCNTVTINNGELGAMTTKYCEENYAEEGKETWSCLKTKEEVEVVEDDGLTNDERLHQHLKNTMDKELQANVVKSLEIFLTKTKNYSDNNTNKAIDILTKGLEDIIFELISKEPADTSLPKEINDQYNTLQLLKFELLVLKK